MNVNHEPGTQLDAQIRALAEQVVAGTPLYVVDVQVHGRGGSQAVNLYVDSDEGVSIEQCAAVSREVGFLLETAGTLGGSYRLNVSSPGADRPLVEPRQYRKHVGRSLRIELRAEEPDSSPEVVGLLTGVDDEGIDLEVGAGKRKEDLRVPYARILRARVQLPW